MASPASTFEIEELNNSVSGAVITRASPRYDTARRNVMSRFDDLLPIAIVECRTVVDVVEVIRFARQTGTALSVRSGGHCFAGFSLGCGIVVDVSLLNAISVDGELARIGSGARLGEISARLYEYGRVLPGGSCPTVGIGGSALGGGFGILGRLYGLTSDHIEAAEVVLGDGSVVTCDNEKHSDLFWALRGAGTGNFGIVTSFTFRTRPAADMTSFYLKWDFQHAESALSCWQRWIADMPDEMAAGLAFTSTDTLDDPAIVELWGAMRASRSDTLTVLERLTGAIGAEPLTTSVETMQYDKTSFYQADILDLTQSGVAMAGENGLLSRQGYRTSKSEFFKKLIPQEGIARVATNFTRLRRPGQYRGIEFAPFGGAYNRIDPEATAFVHRDCLFSIKHTMVLGIGPSETEKAAAHEWVDASWRSLHPWGSGGVYPNFPDLDLSNAQEAYYGSNYPRLRQVKRNYDPDNLFRFAQSIQL